MSGGNQSHRKKRKAGEERLWARRGRRALAALICVLVLLLLASFGLRTPVVLEHLGAPILEAQAERQGLDLEVGAMSGVGLTGVRLYGVTAGVEGGQGRVVSRVDTIDIYPDLWTSLRRRHPVVRAVEVGEINAVLSRQAEASAPAEAAGEVPDEVPGEERGLERWFSDQVTVTAGRLQVGMGGMGRSIEVGDLEVVAEVPSWRIVDLSGQGEVAGVELVLGLREGAIFAGLSATHLDEALENLPIQVEIDGVSLQADGLSEFMHTRDFDALGMELHGLTARPRSGAAVTMHAETSSVQGQGASLRWEAPAALVDGGERQYELTTVELAYRRDASGFIFFAEVSDGEGGRVDLEGHWHLPTSLVGINAWFDDFRWDGTMPWPWGGDPPVRQARVDGNFHGDVDLIHRMVSLDGEARLQELEVDLPFLAEEVMRFDELFVELPITVDARGEALSVVDGMVRLGEAATLGFDARIVEAGGGTHIFHFSMAGEDIEAQSLTEALPAQLTGVIAETKMAGRFGVGVELAGHSAFPESLVMDVNFWGGVQIVEDGKWADRDLLQTGDGVVFGTEEAPGTLTVRGEWQEAARLPAHVPAAMLAAEDATFYDHDGLDWTGLRMAMVQNLKEGALVRGGSTITQQVAKNLFLTHDRTASRKLQEAFLTWRVEETMTKDQILELYLNVAHWGPDIYGIYGASHYYFQRPPVELEPVEAVMLASILPSPIRFGGAVKAGYLPSSRADKMRRVLENMRFLEQLSWAEYFEAVGELDQGRMGSIGFEICADDETAPDGAQSCDEIEVEARDGEEMTFEEWEVQESTIEASWIPLTH